MFNFSFIIPHKNTPDLLQKCLDSIPRRDDVQIIVIDDNSDESKVDFSLFPGLDDPTVEVYLTKEGKGAGYARNVGLTHATGKWLVFADADDYFTDGIIQVLEDCSDSEDDIIFLKSIAIKIPSGEPSYRCIELNNRVQQAIDTGDFTLALLYSSPCQKLFKRNLIVDNGITFNEVRWGNDVVFMGKVASCVKTYCAKDIVAYCITESDNSIIKDPSLQSRLVRFAQECENVKILKRTRFKKEPSLYYWHFRTWFDVWKMNKLRSVILIPKAINASGVNFFKEVFKAKFS